MRRIAALAICFFTITGCKKNITNTLGSDKDALCYVKSENGYAHIFTNITDSTIPPWKKNQ